MNVKRFAVAITLLVFAVACNHHEKSITSSYGDGVVSGQVAMASSVANSSPAGVQVSVQGTGMSMVLAEDGRFTFSNVPENARLHFTRTSDGIDATTNAAGMSMAVELSATTASTSSSRRRSAPITPLLQFEGTVKSATADTLVVTTSFKTDVTVKITTDTVIRKGQTIVAATDLQTGDRVHVKTSLKDNVYTAIEVIVQTGDDTEDSGSDTQTATGNGIVAQVGTNSLLVNRANGQQVTVNVDSKTIIRKYGQMIAFADIHVGDKIESVGTVVDPTTILAKQIEVQDAPGQHGTVVEVEGTVKSVGTSSLVVTSPSAGEVTVNVDSKTKIRKQGKTISLADVHPGDGVDVQGSRVDASTVLAQTIEVHSSGH